MIVDERLTTPLCERFGSSCSDAFADRLSGYRVVSLAAVTRLAVEVISTSMVFRRKPQ
jgi:hypothetical protein